MTTTVETWGNSLGLRIPKDIATKADLKAGDAVELRVEGTAIVLRRGKIRRSITEIIGDYKGRYDFEMVDWGNPKGTADA
jgi:antitoxin MazE